MCSIFFFFNDTATTEIYTLSLHDALPIWLPAVEALLAEPDVAALLATHPRSLVLRAVRETIDAARADGGTVPPEGWGPAVRARAHRLAAQIGRASCRERV